jgi:hypothetical protein
MDPLDQRLVALPAPLSTSDREIIDRASRVLAIEAAAAHARALTAGAPADEIRWATRCAESAATLAELLRRRGR